MSVLVRGILDALDDLGRFAHVDPATTDAVTVQQGAEMVEKKLLKSLAGHGLEIVNPVGRPFDPAVQEAVTTTPALSAGFSGGLRVQRPAASTGERRREAVEGERRLGPSYGSERFLQRHRHLRKGDRRRNQKAVSPSREAASPRFEQGRCEIRRALQGDF
jgi:hypothetical protein